MNAAFVSWLRARAGESSTWAGLIVAGSAAAGWAIPDSTVAAVAQGVAAIAGLFLAGKQG